MPLLLNAMQKTAVEDRTKMCVVTGMAGTGKTAVLTEKARYLHEEGGMSYSDIAVIFQSERDAQLARNAILSAPVKAGSEPVKPYELRFFGTFLSVTYELLRQNICCSCLEWFKNGFSVIDSEQEYDLAIRLMTEKDYGIFKNNLRLKIGRALRGVFVGSDEENLGLKNLHDALRAYLRDNRIIIRDKLPEWLLFLAGKTETKLPRCLMVDNIHRTTQTEWKAILALATRTEENTFTLDSAFPDYHKVEGDDEQKLAFDILKDSFAEAHEVRLEHNYRSSQLPLVCACRLASEDESNEAQGRPTPAGNIGISSFTDNREAAESIATQIEELRIRGAQFSEIGILFADCYMQKSLMSVFREQNIPFENGFGDYIGASTAAFWLLRVLRYSINPNNVTSGTDAVYDRKLGDVGLRRADIRNDRSHFERIPSRSALYQKMRWFVSTANETPDADTKWLYSYFDIDSRLRRNQRTYENALRGIRSMLDTIEALRCGGRYSLIGAVAQFLSNYNVRGRYALIRPFFPNCVHIAHYKTDVPYNFPFLFITDCNDGKISAIDYEEEERIEDKSAFYTAIRRCSFELMLSFMRTRTAKNGIVHNAFPSPLLSEIPGQYITGDQVTLESLKKGKCSRFPEESLVSYEDFMSAFDDEQMAVIRGEKPITLLRAPIGTGKTRIIAGRILYLNHELGVPFKTMFVSCFSKRAVADIMDTILHIRGLSELSPVLDFPLFGTFESLCVKLLNKRLRISDFGYGRGFRIQKEDLEFHTAMQITTCLREWASPEEQRYTVNAWLEGVHRIVYSNVCAQLTELCGPEILPALEPGFEPEALEADPMFKDFQNKLCRWKKDNNIMSMRDARCLAASLVGDMGDQISDVIVDEFQDFDALQLCFVNNLVNKGSRLFAAGDPEQVIYEWKYGGNRSFECFAEREGADLYTLSHNYRSPVIASCVQGFIASANNATENGDGNDGNGNIEATQCENVNICSFGDVESEGHYVVDRILDLHRKGVEFKDIAVFFRSQTAGACRLVSSLLQAENVPVNVWASNTQSAGLHQESARQNANAEGISLLSLHRSKGLQYPYVIIIDCAQSDLSRDRFHSLDNEQRLLYVGMTRASVGLELLYVRNEEAAGETGVLTLAAINGIRLDDPVIEGSVYTDADTKDDATISMTNNDIEVAPEADLNSELNSESEEFASSEDEA